MATPTSTYRIQLTAAFGFRETAAVVPYLASLGVSHVYLSPILEAAPGSPHGYDVVDHGRLSTERGGVEGWHVLQSALREHGLGCVVDIVPNHMAMSAPESANPALWAVLRDGREAKTAHWFDVDWAAGEGKLVLPMLGTDLDDAIARGELVRDGDVLRYHEHELPVTPASAHLPWPDVVHAQHYALTRWTDQERTLNYRRFFDITELIGLRVEDDDVFEATHRLLLDLVDAGDVQGLRVDHPDGLVDPRGYLRRLRAAAPDAWLVVEKILGAGERLPADWPCDGTTGYDTLRLVDGTLVNPFGMQALGGLHRDLTGERRTYPAVVAEAKRDVLAGVLGVERARLAGLAAACLPVHGGTVEEALDELLVAMPVYRTYLVAGEPAPTTDIAVVDQARHAAEEQHPRLAAALHNLADLLLGRRPRSAAGDELVVRFQQLASALTAKGVEDTAGYRWHVLSSLCEVGGDPHQLDVLSPDDCHDHLGDQPFTTMTTLSTHDTKRGEDVRARLALLSELPAQWSTVVTCWQSAVEAHRLVGGTAGWGKAVDPATAYLMWQTLVGAWPIDAGRLTGYLEKACREAKRETSWLTPDPGYEQRVRALAEAVLADPALRSDVQALVDGLHRPWVANVLAQKLLQLTVPGVPDCYQGAEATHLALVDPDNRRPVDYGRRGAVLARLDRVGARPDPYSDLDAAKLYVTSRTLRLRRQQPDAFVVYRPLRAQGPTADHVLAYSRGSAVTVVPRLPVGLYRAGGWQETRLPLPPGKWTDAFTGGQHAGTVPVADLLAGFPVALLHR